MSGAALQPPRPAQGEGQGVLQGRSRGSPAAPGEAHGEAGCALSPWGLTLEQIPPAARGDPTLEQVDAQRRP